MKTKVKRTMLEGVEGLFVSMIDRFISLCPAHMRVTVVIYHPERGPLIIGNCCATCTGGLIHMAAEMVDDPRDREHPFDNVHEETRH